LDDKRYGEEQMKKRTYVLVHGGGHGGWCYQRLAPLLRQEGHDVYTPTLTGLGERSHLLRPDVDLDTHITDVVNLLNYEGLQDVILVGHSYGGMVITGIADRASAHIGHLVFLDAANPVNGESLATHAKAIMDGLRSQMQVVNGVELVMFPSIAMAHHLGITNPDDVAWVVERLTPHPWKSFAQPLRLTNEGALWKIPQTHIVCTPTLATRDLPRLNKLTEGRIWDIDTGHNLMITEPRKTADALLRVARL
jgi:pimeloyl-ACP methyl ester carboxylesterase